MQAATSVRLPRSSPAKAYSERVSGTGVTAPRVVAGSLPRATATGKGSPGCFACQSRKSRAPPRWESQRMITRFRPSTCMR